MSLSNAHVPICVAVRYRMLFMSKHRSAPSSDWASSAPARSRRALRRRSKLTRSSQSTAIRPKVLSVISVPLSNQYTSELDDLRRRWHSEVLERGRERDWHVHCAHSFDRGVELIEGAVRDHRSDLGGHAVALIALVDHDGVTRLHRRAHERIHIERDRRPRVDHLR